MTSTALPEEAAGGTAGPPGAASASSGRLRFGLAILAGIALAAFVVLNRHEIPAFVTAVRAASPTWLLFGVVTSVAGVALGYGGTHRVTISASGSPIRWRDGVPLGMRAFALNTIVKSGGLAGIVPYLRYAERSGSSRSRTRTGYLLANVLGDVAIGIAMVFALIVLAVEHRLSAAVIGASAVFGLYLGGVAAAVFAASRSPSAVRRVHALPSRVAARIRRRVHVPDHTAADEMFAAVKQLRQRPTLLLPALGWAVLVDGAGIVTLLFVLRAFGEKPQLSLAVSAYAVSMLFALLSVLPGGLGFAEFSLAAVLVGSGISTGTAAAIAITHRVLETWLPAALGLLVRLPHSMSDDAIYEKAVTPTRRRIRRALATLATLLGLVQLWLAATRVPVLDVGALLLDPLSGRVRGSRYLILACGLALLVAARGLVRGSQRAWRVALVAATISALLFPFGRRELLGTLAALALIAPLVGFRSSFRAATDWSGTRAGLQWLLGGGAVVLAYGTIGLYFLDTEISENTTIWRAFDNATRLLFVLPSTALTPVTRHASWFIDSVRVLASAVFIIGVTMLVRPVVGRARHRREDIARVAETLAAHGRTGLAHFQLLPDKSYVFSPDRAAFVGYRRIGAVAVALGEPIGDSRSQTAAAKAFLALCDRNGWTPAFHQVTSAGLAVLEPLGLPALKIGEEAIIDLASFTLAGSHFKRLRNQLKNLASNGIIVEELAQPIDEMTMRRLHDVSEAWMHDSGHRERTFSLGAFDEAELRRCVVLAARSERGIEAFVNVVPSYIGDEGNFDLMRRRPDAPSGVMDLLLVSLVERFRTDGRRGMTLGLAPLMNVEGTSVAARALKAMSERDSKAFNFNGLRLYKEKWRPRWEPRYLVYPSELSLIRIGYAVARVGELRTNAPLLLRFGVPRISVGAFEEARSGITEAADEPPAG